MKAAKECISNNIRISRSLNIISEINYIVIDGQNELNEYNCQLAENTAKYCVDGIKSALGEISGTVVAILDCSIECLTESILSIKCDFTVTNHRVLLYHSRFCENYLLEKQIFLLPSFIKGLSVTEKSREFYLRKMGDALYAVPIANSHVQPGVKIGRRSEIDKLCDAEARKIVLKLPHCLTRHKVQCKDKKIEGNKGLSDG